MLAITRSLFELIDLFFFISKLELLDGNVLVNLINFVPELGALRTTLVVLKFLVMLLLRLHLNIFELRNTLSILLHVAFELSS